MAARSTQSPHLVNSHQAARLLAVPWRRLNNAEWRRRFSIPTIRVGGSLRFDVAELRQWLEQRREQNGGGDAA
jgi:hypothetical protein